ncbi:caspase, EACC1-associated type [Nocardia takedensis]
MTRRPDAARSAAVLIGTSHYNSDSLSDIPAVANNLADLTQLLLGHDTGTFSREFFETISDPSSPGQIGEAVGRASRSATDVLLVYYAGHGLLDSRGRLHLGLTGSDPGQVIWTALPFDILREELADSRADIRILILDCCFSARAFETMSDASSVFSGQTDVKGTYTIASSAQNQPSYAPAEGRHTAFSGALIEAASKAANRSLDGLYREIEADLIQRSRPSPHRRSIDRAGDIVLFNKAIYRNRRGTIVDSDGRVTVSEDHFRGGEEWRHLADVETWWRVRAEAGDPFAMLRLGEVLDIQAFRVEAMRWYEQAAKAGNSLAMHILGEISERQERPQAAMEWYEQALRHGYQRARYAIHRLQGE